MSVRVIGKALCLEYAVILKCMRVRSRVKVVWNRLNRKVLIEE